MDTELRSLENKINEFVELCDRLRVDNQRLRQELAAAQDNSKRLEDKIVTVTARLEALLSQIPAEDDS